METHSVSKLLILLLMVLYHGSELTQCSVTYDKKAILINGQRRILISGSIHYPRSTPEMWEDLIQKAKDGGLDVIDTYVFWNVHEPSPGNTAMQGFTQKIVQMMKNERLFASQGGLIILSQFPSGPLNMESNSEERFHDNEDVIDDLYDIWLMRSAVREIGEHFPTAIISGRSRNKHSAWQRKNLKLLAL